MATTTTARLIRPGALQKTFENLDRAADILAFRTTHHLLARPFHDVTKLTAQPTSHR